MNAYLWMVVVGFLMVCVDAVGHLKSTQLTNIVKEETVRIVDLKGQTIRMEYYPSFFDRYEIKEKRP